MGSPTWLTPFCEAYDAVCGKASYTTVVGVMARYFKPLVDEVGEETVLAHWRQYLKVTETKFLSPFNFASRWATYKPVEQRHPAVPLVNDGWIDPEWQEWLSRMGDLGK